MAYVSIRDLRNRGGDVVARAAAGEPITITSSGEPVAELCPLERQHLSAETLLARWRRLPAVDSRSLRDDVARLTDQSL